MAKIGFIGLGHMGLPMAINLIKAGHTVTGFDLQTSPIESLVAAGGLSATTAQDAVRAQDVVITMLQTGQQVLRVTLAETGILTTMSRGTLFIDCSTIDVASSHSIHDEANKLGIICVDAPVSGGVASALAGTLTFMVGGEDNAFLSANPILAAMGKKIIHAGKAGNGQAAKICNNLILGISMIAVSEGFVLAEKLGLSPQKLYDIVTHASGQCWVMDHYVPVPNVLDNVPANHDYQPGFTVAMMLKDLYLSQQAAMESGVQLPIAGLATHLYQTFNDLGNDQLDFSAIIQSISND